MTRVPHRIAVEPEWINVSTGHSCPICGGVAGCKTHADGNFAACGKRPSDWPMTSGAWLHRVRPAFARMTAPSDASMPLGAPSAVRSAP